MIPFAWSRRSLAEKRDSCSKTSKDDASNKRNGSLLPRDESRETRPMLPLPKITVVRILASVADDIALPCMTANAHHSHTTCTSEAQHRTIIDLQIKLKKETTGQSGLTCAKW